MLRSVCFNENCSSKDAFTNAPSVKCALESFSNTCSASVERFILVITGIAAAVSVFLFIICSMAMYIYNYEICCVVIGIIVAIIINIIIPSPYNLNIVAKKHKK